MEYRKQNNGVDYDRPRQVEDIYKEALKISQ